MTRVPRTAERTDSSKKREFNEYWARRFSSDVA